MENLNKVRDNLIKQLAKEVIEEIEIKRINERKSKKYHNTELLMKNYMALKNHIDKIEYDLENEEDVVFIESITRTKLRTIKMLGYVDSALKIVKSNFKKNNEKYKFLTFEKYYFEKKNIEDICKECNCSKNSVRRWNNSIIEELSLLLWGIDYLSF